MSISVAVNGTFIGAFEDATEALRVAVESPESTVIAVFKHGGFAKKVRLVPILDRQTVTTMHHGEYRVKLFIDGEYQEHSDYFTNDRADAEATAKRMRMEEDA